MAVVACCSLCACIFWRGAVTSAGEHQPCPPGGHDAAKAPSVKHLFPRARSREHALPWSADTVGGTADRCQLPRAPRLRLSLGAPSQLDSSGRVSTRTERSCEHSQKIRTPVPYLRPVPGAVLRLASTGPQPTGADESGTRAQVDIPAGPSAGCNLSYSKSSTGHTSESRTNFSMTRTPQPPESFGTEASQLEGDWPLHLHDHVDVLHHPHVPCAGEEARKDQNPCLKPPPAKPTNEKPAPKLTVEGTAHAIESPVLLRILHALLQLVPFFPFL